MAATCSAVNERLVSDAHMRMLAADVNCANDAGAGAGVRCTGACDCVCYGPTSP